MSLPERAMPFLLAIFLASCSASSESIVLDVVEEEELAVEGALMMTGVRKPVQYRTGGGSPQFEEREIVFYLDCDRGRLQIKGKGFPGAAKHLCEKCSFSLRRNPDRYSYDIVKVARDGVTLWKE